MNENTATQGTPFWVAGDINGFFGLFTNVLTNVLIFSSLMLGVLNMPTDIVFKNILPAIGLSHLIGASYLSYMAKRNSKKSGRTDITALPYGLTVGNMFIVTFLVMAPILEMTDDPVLAWSGGIAWCFIEGVTEGVGSLIGPKISKVLPRAALLGSLAGLALTFIAMKPFMQVFNVPYLGFLGLIIILLGFLGNRVFPFKIPAGLIAIILCTIAAWATGYMRLDPVIESTQNLGFILPIPVFKSLFNGFSVIAPFLVSAIPLGIGNFFETMSNVESAAAAGDEYNVQEVMVLDAVGTMIGAIFGSPATTSVYIGHPGWKKMGARIGYSFATGVATFLISILGIAPLLLNIIPIEALVPILIYIALVIGAQAFQTTPSKHAPAVIIAFLPWLANWAVGLINDTLSVAGTSAQELGYEALAEGNVLYEALNASGAGTILVSIMLASIVAYIIDDNLLSAAGFSGTAAVFSFFGVMHAEVVQIGAATNIAIGYLLMTIVLIIMHFYDPVPDKKIGT